MTARHAPTEEALAALRFLEPELAHQPCGVDIVRALLDPRYAGEALHIVEDDEPALVARLAYHRLLPQLQRALASEQIVMTPRAVRAVSGSSSQLAITALRLERMLVEVGQLLEEGGVEFVVLKGLATRHLDHLETWHRQSSDVDLLVRREQLPIAGTILRDAGYTAPDEAHVLMDKGESWRSPLGDGVDLHTRLHTAARPLPTRWWQTTERFEIAGHRFLALNRAGRLAHAASHYAVAYPNHRILSSVLDQQAISIVASAEERAAASEMLQEIGVGDIVHRISKRVATLLDDPELVLGAPSSRPLDLVLRRAYDRPDLDKVAMKLAKTFGMPSVDRRRVLRNWLRPSEEYLASGGYRSRRDRVASIARRRLHARRDSARR